jgi:hypothetical protein
VWVVTAHNHPEKAPMQCERRFKAAVAQAAPGVFDRERTLKKVEVLADQAAREGARLVVFPEAFVSAYPRGPDFGAGVGSRSDEGQDGSGTVMHKSTKVRCCNHLTFLTSAGIPDAALFG